MVLGISLTVGLSFFLFYIGIPLSFWHGCAYLVLLVTIVFLREKQDIRNAFRLCGIQLMVHAIAIVVVIPFCDLGGDGMATHQEGVLAFESEWNPVQDPYFLRSVELSSKYPVVEHSFWVGRGQTRTFSYLFSAIIAKTTGLHETGKSFHLISLWMAFCGAMAMACRLFKRTRNRWLFALVAAINPVMCYQFLSYWQDGFLAGVYTSLLMVGFLWILVPTRWLFAISFVALSFVLSGLKLAGVGYAGLTAACVYGAVLFRGGFKFYWLVLIGSVNLYLIGLAGVLMGAWTFHSKIVEPLEGKISYFKGEEINAGGSSYNQVEAYYGMNRLAVFLLSMSSRTRAVAHEVELKIPFSTDWDELKTFYYFFEDPRAGGLGVFYSGLLLLAFLLYCAGFRSNLKHSLIVIPVTFVILIPLLFVPTYWARWIPHVWLIPLILVVPLWTRWESKHVRIEQNRRWVFSIRRLCSPTWIYVFCVLAFVNNLLIVVPYIVGNTAGTHILRRQIAIVKGLKQPVLYGNGSYTTNRKWLIDNDVEFEMTWRPEDWEKSYLQFFRTDTRIFLTTKDLETVTSDGNTVLESLEMLKLEVNRYQKDQWLSEIWVDHSKKISE